VLIALAKSWPFRVQDVFAICGHADRHLIAVVVAAVAVVDFSVLYIILL